MPTTTKKTTTIKTDASATVNPADKGSVAAARANAKPAKKKAPGPTKGNVDKAVTKKKTTTKCPDCGLTQLLNPACKNTEHHPANVDAAFADKEAEKKSKIEDAVAEKVQRVKLPDASTDRIPRIIHDNKQRAGFFVQGEVRFEIDPFSLERTIGAASYGGQGVIDDLPDKTVIALAEANGWPCQPFSRDVVWPMLRLLVSGIVEIAWRTDLTGEPPRRCEENQEMRVAKYKEKFAELAPRITEKKEKAKRTGAANLQHKVATNWRYSPTAELLKLELKGQQEFILNWFKKNKKGGSVADVAKGIEALGFKAGKQPAEKVVAFYMNDWLKKTYVTREEVA